MFRPPNTLTVVALLAATSLVACTEKAVPPDAPRSVLMGDASPGPDFVATPAGWFHRSCVHEIPNGAKVDAAGNVTRADGTTFQIPKCQYASTWNVPQPRSAPPAGPTDQ